MKKLHWLLLCLFLGNIVTAQTPETCESEVVLEENLNSIDKCKAERDNNKKPRQIVLSFSSAKRRFLRKRKNEKKKIQKAKDIVKAVSDLNSKGVKSKNSKASNVLAVKKLNKSTFMLHEVDDIPLFSSCNGIKGVKVIKCFKQEISKHIQANFSYPEEAVDQNITGKVSVQFIFDKYGKIKIQKIIDGNEDKILGEYTAELVSKLPKFTPAKKNGKHVPLSYELSLDFSL